MLCAARVIRRELNIVPGQNGFAFGKAEVLAALVGVEAAGNDGIRLAPRASPQSHPGFNTPDDGPG